MVPNPASEFLSDEILVLARYQRPVGGFWDMMIMKPHDSPRLLKLPVIYGSGTVSPDHRWIYYRGEDKQLHVISSSGEIHTSQPVKDYWFGSLGWLDNHRIVFLRTKQKPIGLDIFDPFTGELQTVEPDFKDFWFYDFEASGWRVWKLVVDPTLTRVGYMRDANGPVFTLVDLENNTTLWEWDRGSIGLGDPPVWSPDGKQLAVIASGDPQDNISRFQIFTVDPQGHATQWVDIPSSIAFDKKGTQWSPDGRYIAFYGKSLYVLDLKKRQLVDFCIQPNPGDSTGSITWSPNSKKLIYQRYQMPGLLVDIEKGIAAMVSDDPQIFTLGWLVEVRD